MTFRYSVGLRNARLNAINNALGPNASIRIFTEKDSDECTTVDPAGLIAWIQLSEPPFKDAWNGVLKPSEKWVGKANADGEAVSWRIYDSAGVCVMQGNCSAELQLNNNNIKAGQEVSIVDFTITDGNF